MTVWLDVVLDVPLFSTFTYRIETDTPDQSFVGKRAEVQFGSRYMTGYITGESITLKSGLPVSQDLIKPVKRLIDAEPIFSTAEIELARWIARFYLCAEGEALSAMLPSGKKESEGSSIDFDDADFSQKPLTLSDEQNSAIRTILDDSNASPVYLWGHTGTGKTEVFLQAAEATLAEGKGVIYLVPEIALTHQVIEAVTGRFGTKAAILHSGLTGNKKLAEWMRIRRGEALIVVGARSAVFAPLSNLGLIIMDEEHDSSYKSGNTPRYHARQVAMRRCSTSGARLVMGSATPSLEAWHQINSQLIRCARLTRRLSGGENPDIRIVPLGASTGALSPDLVRELREAKAAGRQSIIFLNRRGFTHFFRCATCGYELKCINCSVSATWHRKQGVMKCHYCGWQAPPPAHCPECGSLDVGYAGFGTEFIEEEVRKTFPDLSVQRIDTDSLTKKGELKKALDSFRKGETDILLGTQMVAKGLNFPGVRLVGIALADTGLHMPDFRAGERTFALITQVAGRAGRFFPDGRVLVQTWSPKNPAIAFAAQGNLEGFYAWELEQRKELGFPPFTRLIRLVFRSKNAQTAEAGASGAYDILSHSVGSDCEILGPAECPIACISGSFRFQLLLKGTSLAPLLEAARGFQTGYKSPPALYVEYDVDPVSLL